MMTKGPISSRVADADIEEKTRTRAQRLYNSHRADSPACPSLQGGHVTGGPAFGAGTMGRDGMGCGAGRFGACLPDACLRVTSEARSEVPRCHHPETGQVNSLEPRQKSTWETT